MKNSSTLRETSFLLNDGVQRGQCWSLRGRAPMETCPECCWKTGASWSLPHTLTLKISLRLSFRPQSLRPGSSSCYFACHFKSRQATWASVWLEIWGRGALGKSMLHQLRGTSSGGTPRHHTSPVSSAWKSSSISTLPCTLETHTEKNLLNVMRNNEFEDVQTNGGNFYLCDCSWQQSRLDSVRVACSTCTVSWPGTTKYSIKFLVWTSLLSHGQISLSYTVRGDNCTLLLKTNRVLKKK